ncbi:hypothetical protein UlMin_040862 [Ulmus minor]
MDGISINQVDKEPTWMTPIVGYLLRGELPQDRTEARTLRMRATRYTYLAGQLYKRGFSNPLLKCVTADQGLYIMREIHEGVCGNHAGKRSFLHKIVRQGYYWPNMAKDAEQYVRSVAHPQSNGQVEAVNKTIKRNMERKLEGLKNAWVEELPRVLWAYRTTGRNATGETPFSMTHGTEAVLPVEVGEPSFRTMQFDSEVNDQGLALNLDLVEIKRDEAAIRVKTNQAAATRSYNPRVRIRRFEAGDLVLKKVAQKQGVFSSNWEGPFRVTEPMLAGSYKLEELNGTPLSHLWNANKLRKYYQ